MKAFLIAAIVLSSAAPVVVVPTLADAQVLAGRGAARAHERQRRPALSAREEDQLYAAQDQAATLDQQIEALEGAGQSAGGLTPEQTTQLSTHQSQKAQLQATIDRLEAKRARHSSN